MPPLRPEYDTTPPELMTAELVELDGPVTDDQHVRAWALREARAALERRPGLGGAAAPDSGDLIDVAHWLVHGTDRWADAAPETPTAPAAGTTEENTETHS